MTVLSDEKLLDILSDCTRRDLSELERARAVAEAAIAADRAQGAGMDWVSVFKDQDGLHFVIAEEIAAKLTYGQSRFYRRQQPAALPEGYVLKQDAACHATGSIIVRHKQSQCGEYVSIYDNRITYLMLKAMLDAAPCSPTAQEDGQGMSSEKENPDSLLGVLEMSPKNKSQTPDVYFTEHEAGEQGWSEWVQPKPIGYLMKCCDCGLVHEMESKVVRYFSEDECKDSDDPNMAVVFRMRRHGDYA